ncbi:rhomboid family intramembrane serine protease [Runella sp.]|uniref:rhomboid family intramembrane serine protease n=1 Tax=Runella sp. TaxID=1960881 RepID=UPI003D0EAB3B
MSPVSLIIILFTGLTSYKGFKDYPFFHKYSFEIERVTVFKEYRRLITSGFLHVDWRHYIFNMYSLYAFTGTVEIIMGSAKFLAIYFASLIGGNLLALYIHRHDSTYVAVGASGAVCGVIFASIGLFPYINITPLFFPFSFPAWIYGIVYVLYCIYGIKSLNDNIGHDAHLAGTLVGLLTTVGLYPSVLQTNYWALGAIALPAIIFIILILKRPDWIYIQGFSFNVKNYRNIDDRYHDQKYENQKKLDKILDKINSKGIDSLSKKEKEILHNQSRD